MLGNIIDIHKLETKAILFFVSKTLSHGLWVGKDNIIILDPF